MRAAPTGSPVVTPSAGNFPATLTRHARQRCQQRAVPLEVLDWLLDHGVRVPAGSGVELVRLDRTARRDLAGEIGAAAYARHDRKLTTAYAVIGADGQVVTVGHRTRRLNRR